MQSLPSTAQRADVVLGSACIVAGGLVAAVTHPLSLRHGSWAAAYLVLVGGVAQYVMGRAPLALGARPSSPAAAWGLVACWNLGNALVLGGTFVEKPILVELGAVPLVGGLALAWFASLGAGSGEPTVRHPALAAWGYRAILLILVVSLPIGIVLSNARHG